MPHEDPRNVRFHCEAHATKPDPRYALEPDSFFKGRFVKAPFLGKRPDGSEGNEWMWVRVLEVDADSIHGELANDPVFEMDIVCGQHVDVLKTNIASVLDPKLKHELLPSGGTA
jgi:uncharacterized protein YegJ (DUF2314 family)